MGLLLDDIELPDDLAWTDQGQPGWSQNTERLVDNRLLIEETPFQGGIPITLSSRDTTGWADREQVDAIRAKVQSGAEMTLSGLTVPDFLVTWRLSDGYPFEWSHVVYPAELYRITMRFITLEA